MLQEFVHGCRSTLVKCDFLSKLHEASKNHFQADATPSGPSIDAAAAGTTSEVDTEDMDDVADVELKDDDNIEVHDLLSFLLQLEVLDKPEGGGGASVLSPEALRLVHELSRWTKKYA
jgi:hypothetical protein